MTQDCKFCESLRGWEQAAAITDKWRKPGEPKTYHEYKVALVLRNWTKGNKSHAGRTTDYRYRGIGFDLNYCPECGRRL